jgi:hypothetical protein
VYHEILGFRYLLTLIDDNISFLTKGKPLSGHLKCVPTTRLDNRMSKQLYCGNLTLWVTAVLYGGVHDG